LKTFLSILCVLAFLAGFAILGSAKSAIHEIESLILFLIGSVLLVGASTVESINQLRNSVEKKDEIKTKEPLNQLTRQSIKQLRNSVEKKEEIKTAGSGKTNKCSHCGAKNRLQNEACVECGELIPKYL